METAELTERVTEILKDEFKDASVMLDPASPSEKVGGLLIWDGFDQMEQLDRQRRLSKALRAKLSRDELIRVTAILTLTPAEYSMPEDC